MIVPHSNENGRRRVTGPPTTQEVTWMGSDPSDVVMLDGKAREVMVRVTLDRLLDELDELLRLVRDGQLDRGELRTKLDLLMTLACAISDGLPPAA